MIRDNHIGLAIVWIEPCVINTPHHPPFLFPFFFISQLFTLYTSYFTLYTSHFTLHTSYFTLHSIQSYTSPQPASIMPVLCYLSRNPDFPNNLPQEIEDAVNEVHNPLINCFDNVSAINQTISAQANLPGHQITAWNQLFQEFLGFFSGNQNSPFCINAQPDQIFLGIWATQTIATQLYPDLKSNINLVKRLWVQTPPYTFHFANNMVC